MSRAWLLVLPAMLLGGCKIVPTYHLPKGAEYAKVNLKDIGSSANPRLCLGDQVYQLSRDPDGYGRIPAGERVAVGIFFFNYVYNGVSSSCMAGSSFVPHANLSYYLNFEVEAERCTALVYREGVSNRIGLGFEPSLAPSNTCPPP